MPSTRNVIINLLRRSRPSDNVDVVAPPIVACMYEAPVRVYRVDFATNAVEDLGRGDGAACGGAGGPLPVGAPHLYTALSKKAAFAAALKTAAVMVPAVISRDGQLVLGEDIVSTAPALLRDVLRQADPRATLPSPIVAADWRDPVFKASALAAVNRALSGAARTDGTGGPATRAPAAFQPSVAAVMEVTHRYRAALHQLLDKTFVQSGAYASAAVDP
jgi:hypothetical protein